MNTGPPFPKPANAGKTVLYIFPEWVNPLRAAEIYVGSLSSSQEKGKLF